MAVSFYLKSAINLQDSTPVFNKRLFKAQAGIVLTEEILAILKRPLSEERSKPDLHKLKSVVNGLKDIHKDLQFIKDALCYVVGYEKVGSNIQVKKQSTETDLSCYYILNGSIEATYVIGNGDQDERTKMKTGFESFQFQRRGLTDCKRSDGYEIKYTHIAGDYLGLVSGDGPEYDLPPPYSIRTTEVCEFLRIDRTKFHQAVRKIHSHHVQEIEHFINSGSILRDLPLEERQRLVSLMARQEYAAGKVIVNQGDFPDHIFFVGKGRCQFFRRVFIKEARRLELVKLGHIEQGDVFGESSVLDGSPCFCSVSTIGQVTCYLINKWAIKHNEHVLNLLREHEHHFFEDCTIQHYIRDSDVWQSYKRSKINELLETTSKRHIIIEKKHVPEPLALVVEFGDAKRSHSSQSLREREPGEPESKQPLFVVPRSRRKSSAILQSNAAAVVKAVLLLRRNAEDSSKEPLRLPKFKTHEPRQQSRVKPRSAPGRYRSFNDTSYSQDESNISVKCDNRNNQCRKTSSSDLDKQSKKKQQSAVENGRRSKSVNEMHLTGRGVTNACPSLTKRQTPSESRRVTPSGNNQRKGEKSTKKVTMSQTISTTSQKSKDQGNDFIQNEEKHRASGSGMEKFVSTSGNFIVKKIINTGNPKRLPSSQGYQRFGISMFAILDDEKAIENNRQLGPNPWGVSYAASKWMSGIRKKRLSMLNKRDQVSSPVPTPLIVIEEYAPEKSRQQSDEEGISTDSDCSSEDVEVHSDKYSIHTKKTSRRSKGTPSPSLEQLKEEDEEDIKEYDKHAAGNAVEESWYTPIHKARDQSHSCLEQLRKELEALQCSPNERRRRRHGGSCEKESTAAFDDQLVNDVKKDDIENQSKDESEATEDSPQSSANQRHRQRKYSTRKRSRTHSTSTVSDTQTLDEGSPRRSDSPRIRKRFSNQIRNFTSDQGLAQPQEFILAEEVRNNEKKTEKTTKHERRRLLLLEKIGL